MAKRKEPKKEEVTVGQDFRKRMMPVGNMKSQVVFGTEVYEIEFLKPNWDITIGAEIAARVEADQLMGSGGGISEEEAKNILSLCICKEVARKALVRVGEVIVADEKDFWQQLTAEQVGMIGAAILAASRPNEVVLKNLTRPAEKPGTQSQSQGSEEAPQSVIQCSDGSSSKQPCLDTVTLSQTLEK